MTKQTAHCVFVLSWVMLIAIAPEIHAAVEDANRNAATDLPDNKSDSKQAPPIEKETPSLWDIRIGAPVWIAGISGDIGVKGVVSNIDISFDELFDHLTHVPIVLSADVRYRRWEFFGDGQYMKVGASASLPGLLFTTANVHVVSALAEGFVGYRLIDSEKGALSLFAGARYSYMEGELSIINNRDPRLPRLRELLGIPGKLDFSGSTGWVDPVVGARGKLKIGKAVSLYAEGDIGGFDVNGGDAFEIQREGSTLVRTPVDSSDWSYQVQGGLEIQVTRWMWAQIGWRYLKYDYRNEGFTNEIDLNGPFLQAGVNF